MATNEAALLSYVKTQVLTLTPSNPADSTGRVYVTPDDYSSVNAKVPFVIVNRQQESIVTEKSSHGGLLRSRWNLEIFVFLYAGELVYPSQSYATMELEARQWWSAIVDMIHGVKQPFSTHGKLAGSITSDVIAMQFNQKPFNGLYVTMPVIHNV